MITKTNTNANEQTKNRQKKGHISLHEHTRNDIVVHTVIVAVTTVADIGACWMIVAMVAMMVRP